MGQFVDLRMSIALKPVATVHNSRKEPIDDNWGEIISEITLSDGIPEAAFDGISEFSHLEVVYYFNRSVEQDIVFSGRPRGNPAWPVVGIFAQRKKDRPNALGLCTVALIRQTGRSIWVKGLDAIDGTPVLDIKPVFREFEPSGVIQQPVWASELMEAYW